MLDFLNHGNVVVHELVVLCGDDDGVDAQRLPVGAVFHRNL